MILKYSGNRALICGVTGQDGSYLARHLLQKGYEVYGSSRDAQGHGLDNLKRLNILDSVRLLSVDCEDFRSILVAVETSRPEEVYLLAGQSSVGLSFDQPSETIQSCIMGTLNMLEVCRMSKRPIRIYHAGSSECFGDTNGELANELTPFNPCSPYAVAKASSHWLVANYRKAYGLYACTGLLFNHESTLRPKRFVTQKIVQAAKRIKAGSDEKLHLGRLDISRDWGWAPEYVDAMWRMLQQENPEDFLIATGDTQRLQDFVACAFDSAGLDWMDYVVKDASLMRPSDLTSSNANPEKAQRLLGWSAETFMPRLVEKMMNEDL